MLYLPKKKVCKRCTKQFEAYVRHYGLVGGQIIINWQCPSCDEVRTFNVRNSKIISEKGWK